jgi:hypothetical protein
MPRPRTAPGAACARLGFVPCALYSADPRHQPSPPARGKCRRRVAKDLGRYGRRAPAGVRAGRGKRVALPWRTTSRVSGSDQNRYGRL